MHFLQTEDWLVLLYAKTDVIKNSANLKSAIIYSSTNYVV